MRHITMALAFAAVAMTGFLALPTAFHDVAASEAALVTGGACVGAGPVLVYCSPRQCALCGQGNISQSSTNCGSGFSTFSFACPCGGGNNVGAGGSCSSS